MKDVCNIDILTLNHILTYTRLYTTVGYFLPICCLTFEVYYSAFQNNLKSNEQPFIHPTNTFCIPTACQALCQELALEKGGKSPNLCPLRDHIVDWRAGTEKTNSAINTV